MTHQCKVLTLGEDEQFVPLINGDVSMTIRETGVMSIQ